MTSLIMVLLLLAPLFGFLINGLGSLQLRRVGLSPSWEARWAGGVGTVAVFLSFLSTLFLGWQIFEDSTASFLRVTFFDWLRVGGLELKASFVMDALSFLMCLVITGVGSLIHLFSVGYMSHDPRPAKYFAYLNLFVFCMLVLVLGSSLPLLFIGWEGVGLCSYLLIGFWFTDVEKANAGMKAFIINRVGDAALLLGGFLIFMQLGTLEFDGINAAFAHGVPALVDGGEWVTVAALLLFLGATGKSAQIPLYTWLPDAMAGPTPVSALIHAATMVTAGVYLIVRLHAFYLAAPVAMNIVAVVGLLTVLLAAAIALVQWDIKKVLAYSTISQLGYMFLACGVGAFGAAMFHLITHAFFKALMFLGAGSVIHALNGEQDMRRMGGLRRHLPITYITFVIGWLAIIGFPLFSGFFSKDEILFLSWHSPRGSFIFWFLGVAGAGMTAFYMTRLMVHTFWAPPSTKVVPHESPPSMTIPLIVLGVLALIAGGLGIPHIIGHPLHIPHFLEEFLGSVWVNKLDLAPADVLMEWVLMSVSVLVVLLAVALSYLMNAVDVQRSRRLAESYPQVHKWLVNKAGVDDFYQKWIVCTTVDFSRRLCLYLDIACIDRCTYVLTNLIWALGRGMRRLHTGNLQHYLLYMVAGFALIGWLLSGAPS